MSRNSAECCEWCQIEHLTLLFLQVDAMGFLEVAQDGDRVMVWGNATLFPRIQAALPRMGFGESSTEDRCVTPFRVAV